MARLPIPLSLFRLGLVFVFALGLANTALAAEPQVTISSPSEGATLDVMEQNQLAYSVTPGPRGDHVHVYVDDQEIDILRSLEGSYTLPTLEPGQRNICIKVVNKAHVPIGVENCVNVAVE